MYYELPHANCTKINWSAICAVITMNIFQTLKNIILNFRKTYADNLPEKLQDKLKTTT